MQLKIISMIKPLRKRHLQIWTCMAVLIPLGIISAWLVVPKPVTDRLLDPASSNALQVVIKTISTDHYSVSLRKEENGSSIQLEWINKSPLTAPSAIIYQTHPEKGMDSLEAAALIGRIDSRGVYHFPLKNDSLNLHAHFVLYDIVHHQVIDRINF
jgi:hypothetical protein